MFRLSPETFDGPGHPSFWLFVAVVAAMHIGFWWSLYWWVARFRNPLAVAGGYFLSHTAVAAIVLPFLLSAAGDEAWVMSFYLCCIDLPIVPFVEWMTGLGSRTKVALAYIFIGGGMYAIIGLVIGSVALLYRANPQSK